MSEALARLDGQEVAMQDAWAPGALKAQVELEKQRRVIMLEYFRSCMIDGHHYYRLPGQEDRKPALSKEGALNICSLYKVIPVPDDPIEIWHPDGHYTVRYRTRILSLATGQVMAVGDGMCSTRESKYAYRQASKLCPACGKPSIIKGREEYGGGWVCFKRKDGCGAKFVDGDPTIEQQPSGRIPNEDLADQCNTVLKMSEKRSSVDGVLKLPLVSELFTQDLEEQIESQAKERGAPAIPRPVSNLAADSTGTAPPKVSAEPGPAGKFTAPEMTTLLDLLKECYQDETLVDAAVRRVMQIPPGQSWNAVRLRHTMRPEQQAQLQHEAHEYAKRSIQLPDDTDVPDVSGPTDVSALATETRHSGEGSDSPEAEESRAEETSVVVEELGMATSEQLTAMKMLAQAVGADAFADTEAMIMHHKEKIPVAVYERVMQRLYNRSGQRSALRQDERD